MTEDDPAERHEAHEVDGGDVAERTTDLEDRFHGGVRREANKGNLQAVRQTCTKSELLVMQLDKN